MKYLRLLSVMALVFFAAAGLGRAAFTVPAPDPSVQADAVAAGIRCPTCDGQSVADSESPIAAGMRRTIGEQIAAGRTQEQVFAWFAERYGQQILLSPPRRGASVLIWLVPQMLLIGVLVAVLLRRRRMGDRQRRGDRARDRIQLRRIGMASAVLMVAGVGVATGVQLHAPFARGVEAASRAPGAGDAAAWTEEGRERESAGNLPQAAMAYEHAYSLVPQDNSLGLRLAFVYLRLGRGEQAARVAGSVLARSPDQPEALLLLGIWQRSQHDPAATGTLEHFLKIAGGHPAAAHVRQWLDEKR